MKIFLSAIENQRELVTRLLKEGIKMKWNLLSFYYISKGKEANAEIIRDNSEEVMVDSGAHSFQKGTKVNWLKFTLEYAEFIKRFDRPNVVGYFEMDVDNIIGYDKVLKLREILESVSDKIIPVWHRNRGIQDYKDMCQRYAGRVIAITGFKNEDIKDEQYLMFLKYAKKYNCKVHCLGMTRSKVLDKVPFDYTDSSSWLQYGVYGQIYGRKGRVTQEFSKNNRQELNYQNYLTAMERQRKYYEKWRSV